MRHDTGRSQPTEAEYVDLPAFGMGRRRNQLFGAGQFAEPLRAGRCLQEGRQAVPPDRCVLIAFGGCEGIHLVGDIGDEGGRIADHRLTQPADLGDVDLLSRRSVTGGEAVAHLGQHARRLGGVE